MERTKTGFELFPKGRYLFTVEDSATKGKTQSGKTFYLFKFWTEIDGEKKNYTERFMSWLSGDLLRALGCKEVEPDDFEWDLGEVVGRQIVATVIHEPDRADFKKFWPRLRDIKALNPELPLDEQLKMEDESEVPF